jgi:hypothetical protein
MFCDNPHISEATANQAMPIRKIRRRPSRSPSEPPTRMNEAKVRVYALTVHCRPDRGASRSSARVGRATLTTVASSIAIEEPRIVVSRIQLACLVPHRMSDPAIRSTTLPPSARLVL